MTATAEKEAEVDLQSLPERLSQEQIQKLLDASDDFEYVNLTVSNVKRAVAQFEKRIQRNQELRIQHENEPEKFLKSEVDLDEEIKKFSALAADSAVLDEFRICNGLNLLFGCLSHSNTDIAVEAVAVIAELTEPDTVADCADPDGFIDQMMVLGLPALIVDVLVKIDEFASPEDFAAVSTILHVMENLSDLNPDNMIQIAKIPKFINWLIRRIRGPTPIDFNKVYASELLNILLSTSESFRVEFGTRQGGDGVDKLLRCIAGYRKKDPESKEEEEFLNNLTASLCALMLVPSHRTTFGQAQGIELIIRMLKERKVVYRQALKLCNFAVQGTPANCDIIVAKSGLRQIFGLFMKKGMRTRPHSYEEKEDEEHLVSIIMSLVSCCTGDSLARVLHKFLESRSEKLERLLELHQQYHGRVAANIEGQDEKRRRTEGSVGKIARELGTDDKEDEFLRRCDKGLFILQQVDKVIVRLGNLGNEDIRRRLVALMGIKGVGFQEIQSIVTECVEMMDEPTEQERWRQELSLFVAGVA